MKNMSRFTQALCIGGFLFSQAVSADEDGWQTTGRIYGWVPEISQEAPLTLPGGEIVVSKSQVLDTLDMTFMGNIEMRKDRLILLADIVYSKNSDKRQNTFGLIDGTGPINIDTQARATLKSWTYNIGIGYKLLDVEGSFLDVYVGARYVDTETIVEFDASAGLPNGEGRAVEAVFKDDSLDGVVGLRGEVALKDAWFVPYHFDAGTGDHDFTIQAATGVGYRWGTSAMTVTYRYLRFDEDVTVEGQSATNALSYQGPAISYAYTF